MKTFKKHFVPLAICIMIMAFVTGCSGTVDSGSSTSSAATRLRLATGTEQSDSLDAVGEELKGKELSEANVIAALKNNGYTWYENMYGFARISNDSAIPGGGVTLFSLDVNSEEYVDADFFIFYIVSATDSGLVNYAEACNNIINLSFEGIKSALNITNPVTYLSATKYTVMPTGIENEWLIVIDVSFDIPASEVIAYSESLNVG